MRILATSVCVLGFLTIFVGCAREESKAPDVQTSKITPAAFNPAGAPTVEFSVPDMMCPEGCGEKVKEILSEQPGAKDVLVDFPAKMAKVAIDKDKFDTKQAVAALVDHQFKNSALMDAGATAAAPSSPASDTKSVQ
jgi:copper chaperone CopZ